LSWAFEQDAVNQAMRQNTILPVWLADLVKEAAWWGVATIAHTTLCVHRYVENSQWYPDTRFMLPVTKWFMVSGLQGDATKMDFPVWLASSMEGLHDEGFNKPSSVHYCTVQGRDIRTWDKACNAISRITLPYYPNLAILILSLFYGVPKIDSLYLASIQLFKVLSSWS